MKALTGDAERRVNRNRSSRSQNAEVIRPRTMRIVFRIEVTERLKFGLVTPQPSSTTSADTVRVAPSESALL
jgi:hypothetical protein